MMFNLSQILRKVMTHYASIMNKEWKDGGTVDAPNVEYNLQISIKLRCRIRNEEVDRALTISRNYSKRLQTPLGQVLDKIPVLPNVKGARQARKKLDILVYSLIEERR